MRRRRTLADKALATVLMAVLALMMLGASGPCAVAAEAGMAMHGDERHPGGHRAVPVECAVMCPLAQALVPVSPLAVPAPATPARVRFAEPASFQSGVNPAPLAPPPR